MWYLARFLMMTGCRPVAALRFQWSDVREIPVHCFDLFGKDWRKRTLPVNDDLAALLEEIPRIGTHVFCVENGRTRGGRYAVWPQRRWERVCHAAGLPSTANTLRHTFITEAVAAGLPMAKVAKWCGNSVRVIEARYSHLAPDHLKDIAAVMDTPKTSARNVRKRIKKGPRK
jgi:integrase